MGSSLLRDSNTVGYPDYSVVLGNPGDIPIVGDWDGRWERWRRRLRPSSGLLYLKNDLTSGFADFTMVLGSPGDIGLGGELERRRAGQSRRIPSIQAAFFLTDKVCNCGPVADYSPTLGVVNDSPFTGDWVHQGHQGIGVFVAAMVKSTCGTA